MTYCREHGTFLQCHICVESAKWQPIETAPKYEQILMLTKHGAIEGQWDGEVGSGYYSRQMEWYATHWMPLLKPPTK